MPEVTGRLAPSPTGALHVGNARTFLWAWLSARAQGGRVILRVEDLEKRAQGLVLEEMLSDLTWLGLDWDEGPVWNSDREVQLAAEETRREPQPLGWEESGPTGPYLQSLRGQLYRGVFETLRAKGLIYPCICSKADWQTPVAAPHEGETPGRYPGLCRQRFRSLEEAQAARQPHQPLVWRFRVPEGTVTFHDRHYGPQEFALHKTSGDFPVFRTPEEPYYQLAVVADDLAMGVTEVVRGDDLLESTARQILLYQALDAPLPTFAHVPLVVGTDGKRVAKRHGDSRIRTYRHLGLDSKTLIGQLARWSGFSVGDCTPQDLIPLWTWETRPRDRLVLDPRVLWS